MKEQLPKEEILKLFAFVERKNVTYKDVQYEIVDHLASAMEDLKNENPQWSYELCLNQIYKKFPITGFAQLQLEKEEALNKYWEKRLWPYLLSYFKLPKIIITVTAFFGIQYFFSSLIPIGLKWTPILSPHAVLFGISLIILTFINKLALKRYTKNAVGIHKNLEENEKKFLFVKAFHSAYHTVTAILTVGPYLLSVFFNTSKEAYEVQQVFVFSGPHSYLIAYFIVALLIHLHLTFFVFPPLLQLESKQKYAHLNLKLS